MWNRRSLHDRECESSYLDAEKIDGEVVGEATSVTDVLLAAAAVGIEVHDLDDPSAVRWVGGGKFTRLH
ncbi:hypothetical protein [Streptomyces sp. NPDC057460]|uniref:hypothetical protein n=1 Tax=Streptomyces sp. NPDC057460 TaxID=3346141 RepID=UPI003683ACFB